MDVWHSACNDKAHNDERVRVEYKYNVTDGHMSESESVPQPVFRSVESTHQKLSFLAVPEMTLRDWFAGQLLESLGAWSATEAKAIARDCYRFAYAMLAELAK